MRCLHRGRRKTAEDALSGRRPTSLCLANRASSGKSAAQGAVGVASDATSLTQDGALSAYSNGLAASLSLFLRRSWRRPWRLPMSGSSALSCRSSSMGRGGAATVAAGCLRSLCSALSTRLLALGWTDANADALLARTAATASATRPTAKTRKLACQTRVPNAGQHACAGSD